MKRNRQVLSKEWLVPSASMGGTRARRDRTPRAGQPFGFRDLGRGHQLGNRIAICDGPGAIRQLGGVRRAEGEPFVSLDVILRNPFAALVSYAVFCLKKNKPSHKR